MNEDGGQNAIHWEIEFVHGSDQTRTYLTLPAITETWVQHLNSMHRKLQTMFS